MAVDPQRHLSGLNDIVNDLPAGGTLHIILAHGMRADEQPKMDELENQLKSRLQLRGDPESVDGRDLVADPPTVQFNNAPLFDAETWSHLHPHISVKRYSRTVNGRVVHINFYIFEYWQALVYIKCKYIVGADAAVIGESRLTEYCAKPPMNIQSARRLSSKPELVNRLLKTEIMEWGLADAVIAISGFRTVLHQAVGEALEFATKDAVAEAPRAPATALAPGAPGEVSFVPQDYRHRFAFVTESLGSYVISDALAALRAAAPSERDAAGLIKPEAVTRAAHRRAAEFAICGATQVHMLANQLALLRLSEISTTPDSSQPTGRRHPHFFEGCPSGQAKEQTERAGIKYAARQIVAYHEPNDLLSFYTSDNPGETGAANDDTTNVVKPYATVWIPFILADPMSAHTNQPKVPAIMDLVACGYDPSGRTQCP